MYLFVYYFLFNNLITYSETDRKSSIRGLSDRITSSESSTLLRLHGYLKVLTTADINKGVFCSYVIYLFWYC